MINVSELINDPDFCQPNGIDIIRTTVEVVNHQQKETKKKLKVRGIITVDSENEDSMLSEADRNSERIHVFTYERLKMTGIDKIDGKNYLADVIQFNGAEYAVRYCLDDAQYGFCRSTGVKLRADVM